MIDPQSIQNSIYYSYSNNRFPGGRGRNYYGPDCEVGCFAPPLRPVYDSTSRWAPIGPGRRIPNRGRGSINFNIGFGDSRNRGNLNIYKRW